MNRCALLALTIASVCACTPARYADVAPVSVTAGASEYDVRLNTLPDNSIEAWSCWNPAYGKLELAKDLLEARREATAAALQAAQRACPTAAVTIVHPSGDPAAAHCFEVLMSCAAQ